MALSRPYFDKSGRLAHRPPITRARAAQIEQSADWVPVQSSNIGFACWRPKGEAGEKSGLGIWFISRDKRGVVKGRQAIYWYPGAPYDVYLRIVSAPSPGTFLKEKVIGIYQHDGPYPPE